MVQKAHALLDVVGWHFDVTFIKNAYTCANHVHSTWLEIGGARKCMVQKAHALLDVVGWHFDVTFIKNAYTSANHVHSTWLENDGARKWQEWVEPVSW